MIVSGGAMGLGPNNSRARVSSVRTSSACCCRSESAMPTRYPRVVRPTIHAGRLRGISAAMVSISLAYRPASGWRPGFPLLTRPAAKPR